ncbi:hypothetical protein HHI36_020673, partial [Cryptolaemus montrouzieri]
KGIKDRFNERLEDNITSNEFTVIVQRLQELYDQLIRINEKENEFWSPALLIWSISTLISLILNIYNMVLLFNIRDIEQQLSVHLRTYISIGAIILIILKSESIVRM